MASEYNAKLIAELYATDSVERATRISDEMTTIGDAIFPTQIYEAYKKFQGTTMDHYFISDLAQFKSPEADEILIQHILTTEDESDLSMAINRLIALSFYDTVVVERVFNYLEEELKKDELDGYDIQKYSEYLENAGRLEEIEERLQMAFENDSSDAKTKKIILKILLKQDANKYFEYYLSNYNIIKGRRSEIVFVTEITTWKGGAIPKLYKLILESGSVTAKNIIRAKEKEEEEIKVKNEEAAQKKVQEKFLNSDIVNNIVEKRRKINIRTLNIFSHKIFKPNENLTLQSLAATDKASFVNLMIDLRESIGDFDDEISTQNYTLEEMQAKNPNLQKVEGVLNKFEVYLKTQQLEIDIAITKIRNLNILLSKIAHPNQGGGLIEKLKEMSLYELYENENWQELHKSILCGYLDFLTELETALK